jgi:hypothetical protein
MKCWPSFLTLLCPIRLRAIQFFMTQPFRTSTFNKLSLINCRLLTSLSVLKMKAFFFSKLWLKGWETSRIKASGTYANKSFKMFYSSRVKEYSTHTHSRQVRKQSVRSCWMKLATTLKTLSTFWSHWKARSLLISFTSVWNYPRSVALSNRSYIAPIKTFR